MNGAAEQRAQVDPELRHDRRQRAPQCAPVHDAALAQAFAFGRDQDLFGSHSGQSTSQRRP